MVYRLVLLCGTLKSPLNVAIHESLFQGFTKLLRLETQCYLFFSGYILDPALFRGLLVLINYSECFDVTFWGVGFERLTQCYHHGVFSDCTSLLCLFVLFFKIEISRRVTLEELPPVLVLHLKRFVFEKTGGCQKLTKNIDYPVDLEISKGRDLLHSAEHYRHLV